MSLLAVIVNTENGGTIFQFFVIYDAFIDNSKTEFCWLKRYTMTKQISLNRFFLWWAVIGMSVWVGGTIFSMCVIVPMWSNNLPISARIFFTQTSFNTYIWNFFGPPFMVLRNVPQLLLLITGWRILPQRNYILVALACTVFGIVYTLGYVYPINEILMVKAGSNLNDISLKELAGKWIVADRFRFAVMLVGYFYLLKAFKEYR